MMSNAKFLSFLVLALSGFTMFVFDHPREQVELITASQIRQLQSDETQRDNFVIVDVRSQAEMDVSMIPNALTKSEFEDSAEQYHGKTIIVYCAVGVRSGRYAADLNERGWQALNYEGSILDWCEHKLPLKTRNGSDTKKVHTYSERYSAPQGYIAVR